MVAGVAAYGVVNPPTVIALATVSVSRPGAALRTMRRYARTRTRRSSLLLRNPYSAFLYPICRSYPPNINAPCRSLVNIIYMIYATAGRFIVNRGRAAAQALRHIVVVAGLAASRPAFKALAAYRTVRRVAVQGARVAVDR